MRYWSKLPNRTSITWCNMARVFFSTTVHMPTNYHCRPHWFVCIVLNSLTPGRCGYNIESVNSEHTLKIKFQEHLLNCSQVNVTEHLWWKSTLVQAMAWCHHATSHYLQVKVGPDLCQCMVSLDHNVLNCNGKSHWVYLSVGMARNSL